MAKRTSALSGMKVISQFDVTSDTLIRASKHKIPSSIEDEQLIIHSLLPMQPFSCVPGRQMSSYKSPVQSPLKKNEHPENGVMDKGTSIFAIT